MIERLEQQVIEFLQLPVEHGGYTEESFSGFAGRWHAYFKYCFEVNPQYACVNQWADIESVLLSAHPYLTAKVKYLSEKSLVHQLNSQIAEGAELDLQSFDRALEGDALHAFLTRYPVLTRLLVTLIEDTVAYLYKVIGHFARDIDRLQSAFALSGRRIGSIRLGLGDAHGHGETVCSVQVGAQSLVYKPRSNREALFYGVLLEQLYASTANPGFAVYSPVMVSEDNHCWVEHLENRPCTTAAELTVFFQRLGTQVALIHALNGIDFHYENIIACGSSPVMIDLECLFTSAMIDLRTQLPLGGALFKTIKLNSGSVFSSGFVPYSPDSDNDCSGLSRQQQFTAKKKQLVREQGYYRLKSIDFDSRPDIRHLPVLDGQTHSVIDHQDAFLRGFERGYDDVENQRETVLSMLAEHAAGLKTRVLIKNTQRYADFVSMMVHPRFTQCAIHHELLLATLWSDLNEGLIDHDIPGFEIEDLKDANIPCFTLALLSDQLLNAQGQPVARLAIETPYDSCRHKLESLSPADKALQKHILQMCLFPVAHAALPLNRAHHFKAVPPLSETQCLEGAMRIARVIERTRIDGAAGDVGWTFMDTHPITRRHFISPMNNGLYEGMGGLAIFYLSLFRCSKAPHYLKEAERILCSMASSQGHFSSEQSVSAYFGQTSYLYVLLNHRFISGRQTYQATIDDLLLQLAVYPKDGDAFDFIHGWCGAVTVLVNLYQREPRETLRALIESLSLAIQSALILENGTLLLKTTGKPLWTGFSHGISGVLHALQKVWEVTREGRLVELISQWLHAENRLVVDGFWLDLRESATSTPPIKWCHGDAGVLLCRLGLLQSMGPVLNVETRTVLEQDLERCEQHLWALGLGCGFGLCHGDFGNLLCLLKLYRDTDNDTGIARVRQAMSQVAHNFFNEDFLDPRNVPDLGMMLGITGVGQALLQGMDAGLPDVLTLAFASSSDRL
ncbi:type 2 lanthipeptide synthetase LanM [Pseudomonas sp. NFX15]|uniref:type 2 lanthipeptide synthetase LanM n=1 Tax=Pseudomonas sp. NFX15 TaxID=2816958 RepID=UPI003B8B8F80